jgi:hypothetical protein
MKELLKLQKDFYSHLFDKKKSKIIDNFSHSKLESLARLDIYRNNVFGNFNSVLESIFPVSKKILGEKKFRELLEKYCLKFPSKSGNLDEFGLEFPLFLKSYKSLYLKDLAQLELLLHHSFFSKKIINKFDIKKFQKLPQEKFFDLTFFIHPNCKLFSSKFSIFSIWKKEQEVKNLKEAEFVLIFEKNILKISEEEFLFLSLIQKQKKLYEIYKKLYQKNQKEVDIGKFIQRFIANGIIIKYA